MTSNNKYITDLAKQQISKQGEIRLRILKCILLGGPGVGKTTTLKRLLGQVTNLASSGPSPSTGFDKAKVVHLRHQHDLYTKSASFLS